MLNGLGMLFMKLLSGRAQMFSDVRTFWSPEAVKRVTGYELEGRARDAGGLLHLINSGATCLDATGRALDGAGRGVMKPWYEVTGGGSARHPGRRHLEPRRLRLLPGRRVLFPVPNPG